MECRIDWAALPVLVAMFGVDDVETLIARLDAIRAHINGKAEP